MYENDSSRDAENLAGLRSLIDGSSSPQRQGAGERDGSARRTSARTALRE